MEDADSALNKREKELFSPKTKNFDIVRHDATEHEVKEIPHTWEDSDQKDLSPIRIPRKSSLGFIAFLASFLILIVALSLAGWKFINRNNSVSGDKIAIELVMKPYVEGGEITPLTYSVNNTNSLPLLNTTLLISYDKGTGAQDEQNKIREKIILDTVAPGEFRKGDLNVQLYGAENSARTITGRLEYKVAGSNAVFNKTITISSLLKTPPVSIHIEAEDKAIPNEHYGMTVTLKNNTSTSSGPLLVSLTLPTSFTVGSSSIKPTNRSAVWRFENLQGGEEQSITLDGVVRGTVGELLNVKALVGSQGSQAYDIGNVYSFDTKDIQVIASSLATSITLAQGGGTSDTTLMPGDSVTGVVSFENKSTNTLNDVEIVATLSGVPFDVASVSVDGGLYDSKAGTITWNRATQPILAAVAPGVKSSLSFSFSLPKLSGTQPPLSISLTGDGVISGTSDHAKTKESKSWTLVGSSKVSGFTTYLGGNFTNTGPKPPKVNEVTTYTLNLSAFSQNGGNNGKVTFSLPLYVTWLNQIEPGVNITYNTRLRTVTWDVGALEAGKTKTTSFQVSIKPSQTQVNNAPPLTSQLTFDVLDVGTNQMVQTGASALTTATKEGDTGLVR